MDMHEQGTYERESQKETSAAQRTCGALCHPGLLRGGRCDRVRTFHGQTLGGL